MTKTQPVPSTTAWIPDPQSPLNIPANQFGDAYLKSDEQCDGLDAVVSAVDVVAHE